jgi:outer membrane protein assembly factor BamB
MHFSCVRGYIRRQPFVAATALFAACGLLLTGAVAQSQTYSPAAITVPAPIAGQISVLTQHNDNNRTGANLNERKLTPHNVSRATFGKLFTVNVDGQIYAQPLYVSGIYLPNRTQHNIVYVATMTNNLYAIDADNGVVLWTKNYGAPVPASDVQCCCTDISSTIGILSTPVIDASTNTLYFVSRNKNTDGTYHQWLNATDIVTGAAKLGGPKEITGTYGNLTFNSRIQNQRSALTLANGSIYLAWSSHNDCGPYHGWVMSYSAATLQQTGTYVNTPTGSIGGIWQSGQGLTVDGNGNVYFSSGNGTFSADGSNTGNSFVKLSPGLAQMDWFTPSNSDSLNAADADLGSGGLLGIPGTHFVIGGGKQGMMYLVDTNNMGHFNSSQDQVVQEWQAINGVGSSHIHGTPIYYNSPYTGPTMYVWGENDNLRAYKFDPIQGRFNTTAIARSTMTAPVTNANGGMPGGFLSLSALGSNPNTAIIWAATPYNANANNSVVQGIVHAFDATTLRELWSDKMDATRDDIGNFAKFCPPTVANGRVYMASFGKAGSPDGSGALVVYGLLPLYKQLQ